jgi:GntR family transcriptional regulator
MASLVSISREGKVALFFQLSDALTAQIQAGTYAPGDLLPSENDLIAEYSVSRTTVRRAIQELVSQGLVYTVHGKGTFVAERQLTQHLNRLTSFSHDVAQRGMTPSRRILRLETIQPDQHLAAKLRISPSTTVIYLARLLLADNQPVSVGYTYIPTTIIAPHHGALTEAALGEDGLYPLLKRLGLDLTGGEQIVSASAATAEEARLLEVAPGSPLLSSERLAWTHGTIPVEFTLMKSRSDKARWRIALAPLDLG